MLKKMQAALPELLRSYRDNGAMVIFPGVAFTALGIVAIMSPVLLSVDPRCLLGGLLISAGLCRVCLALHAQSSSAARHGFGLSALSFVTGLYLLSAPLLQPAHFTLLLAAYLVADGIFSAVLSLHYRSKSGWGWLLTSSLSTVTLGTMVFWKWPTVTATSAAAAVGLFLALTGAALSNLGVSGEGIAERLTRNKTVADLSTTASPSR